MKVIIFFLILSIVSINLFGQVFRVDRQKILLHTTAALSLDLLNNYVDRQLLEKPTEFELSQLNKNDIIFIDRWSWQPYSKNLKDFSDYSAYLTLGLVAYYTYDDYFWLDNLMVLSQVLITQSAVTKWTKTLSKRYRPFVYDNEISTEKKQARNSQHSFYSMHSSTTFAASTFAYYYHSKIHGRNIPLALLLYSPAAATAYLRVASGNHFFGDVVVGALVGSGLSYLICQSHLSNRFSVQIGFNTIRMNYKF